jgi:hypothetical protein
MFDAERTAVQDISGHIEPPVFPAGPVGDRPGGSGANGDKRRLTGAGARGGEGAAAGA